MNFEVKFVRSADSDVASYAAHERRLILDGISRYLKVDAGIETRRRKRLRPNPLAPWELRMGAYRVFYEIRDNAVVRVLAVGHKEHNDLFIRGRKVKS
jgi:mRNA-degrading endonuclease RelE of RelBE toxin-antitoxin system